MGRIQSTIGLATGLPIQETVAQLLQITARPRALLLSRNQRLKAQQVAVTQLAAKVLGVQFSVQGLKKDAVFDAKSAASSNAGLLSATITGNPPSGVFQFTPVRQVQAQQFVSTGLASATDPIGAGSFSFRFGGGVDTGLELDRLNAGAGVQRGKIRITDRSGASTVIDLRFSRTVDDVLNAINGDSTIQITAETNGDAFRLVDTSGGTSNLKVEDVSGGSTAADLGLGGIDVAASTTTGADILKLYSGLNYNLLNDDNGVRISDALPDLDVTFRDGSASLFIDFQTVAKADTQATATTTAVGGVNAQVAITAVAAGATGDGVKIVFVDDAAITKGNETVVYDATDPLNKTLTFKIDAGSTTATDIIAAVTTDTGVSALFTAAAGAGGNGSGIIDVADTATTTGGAAIAAGTEKTLGDLIATINAADPTRLSANLSASGDQIVLTDLTSGGGSFTVGSALGGSVAEDLGLTGAAVAGVITSRQLQSGLKGPLLDSLRGGAGLGTLGNLDITDRAGVASTIDLSSASTLEDVIEAINGSASAITASVNQARNGITLTDTSGSLANNLIIANGDATNTADALGLTLNAAADSSNSGSLDLKYIGENALLSSLNGGSGVSAGQFIIVDTAGAAATIDTRLPGVDTIGDVIDQINLSSVNVTAQINSTGDGIELIDEAAGVGNLKVTEVGVGSTATELRLVGTGVDKDFSGTTKKSIDGSYTFTVNISATDTLQDIVNSVNALNANVSASSFSDGTGVTPHRLSLVSQLAGKAGEIFVETGNAAFDFSQIVKAQDALLLFGSADDSSGVLVSSQTNSFNGLIDGVSLSVNGPSTTAVNITVSPTDSTLVSTAKLFVDQYNALRDTLDDFTIFDETTGGTGILFGSNEAIRVDTELASLLTDRYFGVGSIQSLGEVGIDVKDNGKLSLDASKLKAKFAADPAAVKEFFTKDDLGVVDKFDKLLETLAGEGSSLLITRAATLTRKVGINNERIEAQTSRLERERDRLLKEFFRLEETISKLQNNQTAIQGLQIIAPLSFRK